MHRAWKRGVWTTAVVLGLAAPAAFAEDKPTGQTDAKAAPQRPVMNETQGSANAQATAKANAKTRKLLEELAIADHVEVMMGNLALEKSQNEQVKQYAQKLVTDHKTHLDEVKQLAEKLNVQLEMTAMDDSAATGETATGGSGLATDPAAEDADDTTAARMDPAANPETAPLDEEANARDPATEGTGGAGTAGETAATDTQMKGKAETGASATNTIVDHHAAMMEDLAKKNPELARHMKAMKKLEQLEGAAFDQAYLKMMVKDHDKDVMKVKSARKQFKHDAEVEAFLARTQPVLEEHLATAKQLQKTVATRSGRAAPAQR